MPKPQKLESHRRHFYKSPTYQSWACMKSRCTRPKDVNYPNYGGRGITFTDEWKAFSGFLADMGVRPAGKTLDRIDPNLNYTKENCRWADRKTQNINRRYKFFQKELKIEAGF